MALTINRLDASCVFRNHRVSKGVFVTVKLLRVAKRPSSVASKEKKKKSRPIRVLMGRNLRRKSSLQFQPIQTQIGRIFF